MAGAFSFRHEKLDVYRRAVAFIARADDILYGFSSTVAVSDHLDRAAESSVKAEVQTACIEDGRGLLVSIVKLLLGMRGYLEGEA